MTPAVASVYRLFKRADQQAAPVRAAVIVMVAAACVVCALAIVRVSRQHEVLRLGYQLSHEAEHVRQLHEVRRRLELERATLTAPERIRKLATALGMTTVAPDRIRVIDRTAPPFGGAAGPVQVRAGEAHSKVAVQP